MLLICSARMHNNAHVGLSLSRLWLAVIPVDVPSIKNRMELRNAKTLRFISTAKRHPIMLETSALGRDGTFAPEVSHPHAATCTCPRCHSRAADTEGGLELVYLYRQSVALAHLGTHIQESRAFRACLEAYSRH